MVERFTNATSDFLSIRVRFVAAVDTRWRYTVYSQLTPVGSGPQGQQIWTLKSEDAQFVLAQVQILAGFKLLTNQEVEMVNGQTLVVKTSETRGLLRRPPAARAAAGQGYQPRTEQLEEGVTLRLSPLLTFDGDMLDAAIELTANTVKNFHRTRVIAPREIGASEITIDVPEVTESRLNQTVKSWPLGQTLLISAGIQPGILQSKTGFLTLRIPGHLPDCPAYGTGSLPRVPRGYKALGRGRDTGPSESPRDRDRDPATASEQPAGLTAERAGPPRLRNSSGLASGRRCVYNRRVALLPDPL